MLPHRSFVLSYASQPFSLSQETTQPDFVTGGWLPLFKGAAPHPEKSRREEAAARANMACFFINVSFGKMVSVYWRIQGSSTGRAAPWERGGAGSTGSAGSAGAVRRIIIESAAEF